jgi:hypothetical protein
VQRNFKPHQPRPDVKTLAQPQSQTANAGKVAFARQREPNWTGGFDLPAVNRWLVPTTMAIDQDEFARKRIASQCAGCIRETDRRERPKLAVGDREAVRSRGHDVRVGIVMKAQGGVEANLTIPGVDV